MDGATDTHSNTVSSIEEENKSELAGGNCDLRKKLKASIDSLPLDIVFFDILTRLRAQDIYHSARFVCRKWNQMIHTPNFIRTHLRHSPCGLLIQNLTDYSITLMELRQDGQIEYSKFSYMCRHCYWSSCNGLVLEYNFNELVIKNPVTMQLFVLPPFVYLTQLLHGLSAIACVPNPMVYKVVRTCHFGPFFPKPRKHCAILTVGIDYSWRLLDTQHVSLSASEHFNSRPLVTGGFVHWALGGSFVLTLDLKTETVSQFPVPRCYGQKFANSFLYFSTASCLSLLVVRGFFKWDVWEMKPETGEWTKLPDIDLEAQKCAFLQLCYDHDSSFKADDCGCKLLPVGWLKYREVLVFIVLKVFKVRVFKNNQSRLQIAYNVRTRDFYWCELEEPNYFPYLVHRNSLLWLNSCT